MKSKLWFIVIWLLLIISFTLAGATLVISASGYKINWQEFDIQKTGLINFSISPSDAIISLDGKLAKQDRRGSIKYLLPSRYDLEIKKSNYIVWSKTVSVEEGLVSALGNIQLFFENPRITDASEKEKAEFSQIIPDRYLTVVNETEIREQGKDNELVSRFSYPIKNPRIFPAKNRIGFLADDGIRAIDATGSNNNLIVRSDASIEDYYFLSDGQYIVYKIGDRFFKARVF